MKHSPYNLSSNFFTLKCRVEKIEELKESQKGTLYLVVWLSQSKYFKEEKTVYNFKGVLFNEAASEGGFKLEEGMWVRVSGELKGSNTVNNDMTFNNIELKINDIEPLTSKKETPSE